MNKFILIACSLIILSLANAQVDKVHACAKHKIATSAAAKNASHKSLIGQEKYDVHYVKLDLELDNLSTEIDAGHAVIKATTTAFSLDVFVLELASSLVVDATFVNGVSVPNNRQGDELQIFPANILSQGEEVTVEVLYHGNPPGGGGFFGGIFNDQSPSWGADVTWTLSQPFSAHTWWPCKQVLTDKIDSSEVWLTIPAGLKGGSNGLLQNEVNLPSGKTRFEWKHQHNIAYYLISIAVGPYIEYNFNAPLPGTTDEVFIQNYIYDNPATLNNFQTDIDETADMMFVFSDLFGLYPYKDEKYGHCMAPLSGGMEHQTMTTQGFFATWLTAHELGHQWFGDNVTCADWGHIWVNEGFASYAQYLFLETVSASQAESEMANFHGSAMTTLGGSVYVPLAFQDDDSRIFSSNLSYDKGATLVHMIRHWVNNDSLFFASLKSYQNKYANGTAVAEDFIDEVETVANTDMTNFLDHWYYGEGYPTYDGAFNQNNGGTVIQLNQVTSRPSVTPFFESSIEFKIDFMDGTDTTLYVHNTSNGELFHFPITNEIYTIYIDDDNWVLNQGGDVLKDESLVYTGIRSLHGFDDSKVQMFPNPTRNAVQINLLDAETGTVLIFDGIGRKVFNANLQKGRNNLNLHLLSGVYIVTVKIEGVSYQEQLLIK